jgi:hypothetical protein
MVTVSNNFEDINSNVIATKALYYREIQRKYGYGLTAEILFRSLTFGHFSISALFFLFCSNEIQRGPDTICGIMDYCF